jgi:hypothetical protein
VVLGLDAVVDMSDDNQSERSDLLSGDDASAPVLPKTVDEPPKASVPVVALAKQSRKWSSGGNEG